MVLLKKIPNTKPPKGEALVTAYAVHRPDGLWSLLLINKDPNRSYRVRIRFDNQTRRSRSVFTGPLDITLERGDLNLRPGVPLGSIRAHSRSGDIRLSLPAAAQFTLNASTDHGDISNAFGDGLKLEP